MTADRLFDSAIIAITAWLVYLAGRAVKDAMTGDDWRAFRSISRQVLGRLLRIGWFLVVGFGIHAWFGEESDRAYERPIGALYLKDILGALLCLGLMYVFALRPAWRLIDGPWWKLPKAAGSADEKAAK
jgi:hypothetical protein